MLQEDCQEPNKIFSYAIKDGLQYCFASQKRKCVFQRFAFILHCSQIALMYHNFQIQLTSTFTLLLTNIEMFLIAYHRLNRLLCHVYACLKSTCSNNLGVHFTFSVNDQIQVLAKEASKFTSQHFLFT